MFTCRALNGSAAVRLWFLVLRLFSSLNVPASKQAGHFTEAISSFSHAYRGNFCTIGRN